jgi:hypothetical protein
MPSAVEVAVDTFIRAWSEPEPRARASLVEACFAADGRFVTRGAEFRGRSALLTLMARIHADPQIQRIRLGSVIDARGTTFRYRGVVENRDGSSAEALDVGEIDGNGQISLVLTFAGPLAEL